MGNIDTNNKTDRELLILLVDHMNDLTRLASLQNGRVSRLESWRDRILGAIGLLVFSLPITITLLVKFIR